MNNNLFGSGREKVLECFYRNRSKQMYFSEILRETKLTQNTTLKHLKRLQDAGIILSTKKIGNTFYRVDGSNPLIYPLFEFFDCKRFNLFPEDRKSAITLLLERLRPIPLIVVVFGSTAGRSFTKESDVDILLVYNKKEAVNRKVIDEIEAVTGAEIQPFVLTYDLFKEQISAGQDHVIMHAIKTGFVISGGDRFYRAVLS